jgi:hypothetical protein
MSTNKKMQKQFKKAVKPSAPIAKVKNNSKKAKKIAAMEGQRGIDTRVASTDVQKGLNSALAVQALDKTIDVKVDFSDGSVQSLALGAVLNSLKKGWGSTLSSEQTSYVYGAYVYLYQAILSAMASTTATIQSAPKWYWILTQAMAPKTRPFKTSDVTYSWNLSEGQQTSVPPPIRGMLGLDVNLGYPDTTLPPVNGMLQITAPTYTDDLGQVAIKSLFDFYQSEGLNEIGPSVDTGMQGDTSAFAAVYPEFGSASGSEGGCATTLYSERYIQHPILAKFATYQAGDVWRGWAQVERSGGSACYIIPKMMETNDPVKLKNHVAPIFKFFNFDEFYEVLSLTVGKALELQSRSNAVTSSGTCPLTAQQVRILLRQTLIPQFCNEMAQDLNLTANNTFGCVPFSVGVNGVSITMASTNMLLPQLLAENIRAATRRIVKTSSSKVSEIDLIPFLGRPFNEGDLGNYTWGPADTPVYSTDPDEIPVRTIDLTYSDNGTRKYLSANGLVIQQYADIWNSWIKSLASFLTPLTSPGQAPGIAALNVMTLTRSSRYQVPDNNALMTKAQVGLGKGLHKQASKKFLGSKPFARQTFKVVGAPDSILYQLFSPIVTTSTNMPLTPLWKYQRVMVLPWYAGFSGTSESATISSRQVFQIEPFKISASATPFNDLTDIQVQNLFNLHSEMAELDVKTDFASVSEVTQDLTTLAQAGEGGFFTNIAGMFAEDVLGIKGGKAIAGAIGAATGL